MNNQTIYWVWLQQVCGYGSKKTAQIRERFTFAEDFYKAPYEEKLLCFGGNENALNFRDIGDRRLYNADRIIKYCRANNIEIVVPGDRLYPERLLSIPNPPAALYVKGDVALLDSKLSIGIVGSRRPSFYGGFMAKSISGGLAEAGFTIVSGGARGIDTTAHKTALYNKGKTICVLGCGIGYNYLRENKSMYEEIAEKGAIVSEYVPMTPTGKLTFRVRDRIISGLSDSVAVIEAGVKSGSLITADYAFNQNRKLYALRKPDGNMVSEGNEAAIKKGAKPFSVYTDIIEDYRGQISSVNTTEEDREAIIAKQKFIKQTQADVVHTVDFIKKIKRYQGRVHDKAEENTQKAEIEFDYTLPDINDEAVEIEKPVSAAKESLDCLTDTAKEVYSCMSGDMIHADTIAYKTGLAISDVNSALTELELFGLVQSYQGNMYMMK